MKAADESITIIAAFLKSEGALLETQNTPIEHFSAVLTIGISPSSPIALYSTPNGGRAEVGGDIYPGVRAV
jgi:hypothetical protein